MKTLFRFFFVSLGVMMLASCASNETANSDTVKQSEIYQHYSITYNSGEKELTAVATFRFGGANGTTLFLVKPSKVLFENQEMPDDASVFSGTFYEMNLQADAKPFYTFIYINGDGYSYTNLATVIPVECVLAAGTIDKDQGFSVEWVYPLQNGENIRLFIEDIAGNASSVYTNAVGSTSMKMNPEELKNIKTGEVNIYLERENISLLENATHLGGKMHVKFISEKTGRKLFGTGVKEENKDTVTGLKK
ncbi:MAG TPA: hypothetical protein PKW80_07690 [Bacteroidales bacterium]|nr:hypothetical protein [Bacteroidales bacterium]